MGSIIVNEKKFETFKDEEGVERFKPNNLLQKIRIRFDLQISELIKLVELGAITKMELLDYYAGMGFTISGVQELSFFEDYEFIEVDEDAA